MHDFGLIPAWVKKSTKFVLNLVCPVLKSFPIMNPRVSILSKAGTKVFWGEPFIKETFSSKAARAKMVEADIYLWFYSMALIRFGNVSWTPGIIWQNLSVFAVQRTITLSKEFFSLKSLILDLIIFKSSFFPLLYIKLSAL